MKQLSNTKFLYLYHAPDKRLGLVGRHLYHTSSHSYCKAAVLNVVG